MSHEENIRTYQEILSAYRKGDEECCPDVFEKAFTALETYPELAEWFEKEQQFDDAFRTALNDFKTPAFRTVKPAPVKTTRISFLKLAASVAAVSIFGSLFLIQQDRAQDLKAAALVSDLREHMAAFAAGSFELDTMNNDLSVLRGLITSTGGSNGDALEQVFVNGTPMGCKLVDWDGRVVSLYCFGNAEGQVVHAFVVPLRELNGPRAAMHLAAVQKYSERDTGGLVVGDTAYLLVGSMPGVDIKPFLLPAQATLASRTGSVIPPIAMLYKAIRPGAPQL